MTEVISGGPPERRPANAGVRRAVAVLAGAAVLAAGLWVGFHRTSTEPAAEHTTDAPGTPLSVPPRVPSSPSPPLDPLLSGIPTGGPGGLRLLAGATSLEVVDAATGARSAVAVPLPPGWVVAQLLPAGGGTLVVIQPEQGSSGGVVYLLRHGRPPVELLRADRVVAGARPDKFWGYIYSPHPGGKATLIEATTGGRVLSKRLVPEGWYLQADTGNGLLVAAYRFDAYQTERLPGELLVIDPRSLAARRSLGPVTSVAAATRRLTAWMNCTATCDLIVGDVRGGQRRTFGLATDAGIGWAVFSPDERHLAISHNGRHGFSRPGTPGFVEVLDLAAGRRTRVPGVGTPEKQAAAVCWSRDGRWLGIAVRWPEEGYQRLAVWPLSGGPLVELPGRLPARYTSALVAVSPEGAAT